MKITHSRSPLAIAPVLLAAFACVVSTARAAVIYTEAFPNTSSPPVNRPMSSVGWNAHIGSTGVSATASTADVVVSTAAGQGGGISYGAKTTITTTATTGVALYFTTEVGTVDQTLLETISFYSNNTNTTDAFRIVIRLDNNTIGDLSDDVWFATNTDFIRNSTTAGSPTNFPTNAELESFAFTNTAGAWRDLTFTPGTALSLATAARSADLPAGGVNAFGLFSSLASNVASSNGAVIRFDTYQVSTIPEPGSALLALCGAAGLLGLRRRHSL